MTQDPWSLEPPLTLKKFGVIWGPLDRIRVKIKRQSGSALPPPRPTKSAYQHYFLKSKDFVWILDPKYDPDHLQSLITSAC